MGEGIVSAVPRPGPFGATAASASPTQRRSEACIMGFVIGLLSWFGMEDARRELLVDYLQREQMPDEG